MAGAAMRQAVCSCPTGVCTASYEGKRCGYVSIISDVRCRVTIGSVVARRPGEAVEIPPGESITSATVTAPDLLDAAAGHLRDRAAVYDKPGGERSMAATVQAFNAITRHTLSESEGWLFMECLKAVRDFTAVGGHADSSVDRIAYAALAAEARQAGR